MRENLAGVPLSRLTLTNPTAVCADRTEESSGGMRPQSAQPTRRASALSFEDADDDALGLSAPIRDVRLNLADNESFYRSPQRTRGSAQRPTSAPPERARLAGTVLSNKPPDQTPGNERECP